MIFLTVGTQLPFDRLIEMVDCWAAKNPSVEINAQIAGGVYKPKSMEWVEFLPEKEYSILFSQADAVIAHAAMGSIISALVASKPIIVVPRKASLGEHRNEHQMATSRNFCDTPGCYVATDQFQLDKYLDEVMTLSGGDLPPFASPQLLNTVKTFIEEAA